MAGSLKDFIPAPIKHYLKLASASYRKAHMEEMRLNALPRYMQGTTQLFGKEFAFADANTFQYGKYEILDKEIYKFKAENDSPKIIDCGANIGLSVLYFKLLYPKSTVLAFEPDEKIAQVLKKNILSFDLQNIQIHNEAVWIENGIMEFRKEGGFSGRLALPEDKENIVSVKTLRLKDLLNNKIDFLKLDIEGAEYEVIKDCKEELKNVKFLFIEYHSHKAKEQTLGEILEILRGNHFRYYIETAFTGKHPFIEQKLLDNMDLQLNIFAIKTA